MDAARLWHDEKGETVALFKPYDSTERKPTGAKPAKNPSPATAEHPVAAVGTDTKARTKKTIATPTRRQAEDARRQRIQPVLTKKQAKQKQREAQNESMMRMHARPYNVLIRDWVDRRWNIAEFMLPIMLIIVVGTVVAAYWLPSIMTIGMIAIYALVIALVVDIVLLWVGLRRRLREYFPHEPLKGKLSYAVSRAMLMRRSRQPPPAVKRGAAFVWPPEHD